jgi:D-alanyl-D-alanine carboxypeptidase/D-alanyl-D-alanine-endopeptidase (penicillin-binding protein 4)
MVQTIGDMGRAAYLAPPAGLRRLLVLAAAALAVSAGSAGAESGTAPLPTRLARALSVPHVAPALTGALAFDLKTGKTLFAQHGATSLAPASTEKLATAYAALYTLGADYRIETDVLGQGHLSGATWQGSLVLKGYGDPTLSRGDLRSLAAQLHTAGIRRVTAGVVGDESFFDSRRTVSGWKPSFYVNESPPLSALIVDRGRSGGIVSPEPALAAAMAFRAALRKAGIAVAGSVRVAAVAAADFPLAFVYSAPLSRLVRAMALESDNFTAEMLLKQLGAVEGRNGSSAAGAAVVRQILRVSGVPLAGVRIVDGSGLAVTNRLTAAALVGILTAAWAEPEIRGALVQALPVAGVSGTLSDRLRRPPARGNVIAKTGTTNISSALSGYVKRRYVFAVVQNGRPVSTWWARVAQDRFVTVLAATG